jgi:hypothetical protein
MVCDETHNPNYGNFAIYRFGRTAKNSLVAANIKATSCADAFNYAAASEKYCRYVNGQYYGTAPGEDVFAVLPVLQSGRASNGSREREPQLFRYQPAEPVTYARRFTF